jgi:hypothetical protein
MHVVNIIMPFGGKETGFYRFPKDGENILVDNDESGEYYLLGYLPSESDMKNNFLTNTKSKGGFQNEINKLKDDEGMILRYQQSGKQNPSADERYSEIGFYRRKSQWTSGDTGYKDIAKPLRQDGESDIDFSTRLVLGGYPRHPGEEPDAHICRVTTKTEFPRIDQINIQSTGDIRHGAKNFHEIKAKRLEILAGLESYDHESYPGADVEYSFGEISNNSKYNKILEKLPFGDSPGDDGNLYTGDMHLRAKNRIVLKAGDEIIIEVGRSSIVINDEGIALTTRKGRKKTVNLWDTKLLLSPQKGISLFGQNLQMEAVNIFEIKENYGGSIKSTSGILRIGGRDIKMVTYPTLKYLANHVSVITNFSQSVSAIDGIHGQGEGASFLLGNYGLIANLLAGVIGGALTDPPGKDPLDLTVTLHGILLSMNHLVVNLICDPKTPEERDTANKAAMIIDFSLNLLFTGAILIGPGFLSGFTHNSILHLRGSAHIDVNSLSYKLMSTKEDDAASPLAGYVEKLKEWTSKKVKDLSTSTKVILGIIGGVIAAGGSSLPGVYVGAIKTTDKKTIDELKVL